MKKIDSYLIGLVKDITLNCSQCGKEVLVPNWIGLDVAGLLGGDGDGCCCFIEEEGDFCSLECAITWLKEEFDEFISSLPEPIPMPIKDLATEIDDLKARIKTLENK